MRVEGQPPARKKKEMLPNRCGWIGLFRSGFAVRTRWASTNERVLILSAVLLHVSTSARFISAHTWCLRSLAEPCVLIKLRMSSWTLQSKLAWKLNHFTASKAGTAKPSVSWQRRYCSLPRGYLLGSTIWSYCWARAWVLQCSTCFVFGSDFYLDASAAC